MKALYPPIEPRAVHIFDVEGGHRLYVEEFGKSDGIAAVFLHGGPGSGCKAYHRSFFDPDKYRVILLDQRGAGRSRPAGGLEHNTTEHLLADLEFVRIRLGVERWLLFGGSWGATLALLYAQRYPARVSGLVLRGTFLARQEDLDWFVKDGARRIYPERWAELMEALHGAGDGDIVAAIHSLLLGEDEVAQRRIARAWSVWGGQVTLGDEYHPAEQGSHVSSTLLHQARIELHYAFHRYFIEENQILRDCPLLPEVPTILIHGRRDLVCPVESAYTLSKALPNAQLRVLPGAGHIAGTAEMIDALVSAADEMAARLVS